MNRLKNPIKFICRRQSSLLPKISYETEESLKNQLLKLQHMILGKAKTVPKFLNDKHLIEKSAQHRIQIAEAEGSNKESLLKMTNGLTIKELIKESQRDLAYIQFFRDERTWECRQKLDIREEDLKEARTNPWEW
mmetsp:Transcript_10846/g.16185  ORF Transcript_10846/g.16185 Transcript_10846/m.16185 type:complete len:135 (+) Transcript_10846:58-462(+)